MAAIEASAALVAVLTMIWLGTRVITSTGLARKHLPVGRSLVIDEIISLDPQRKLVLVSCNKRRVLLMTGGRQDLVVGWLDTSENDS